MAPSLDKGGGGVDEVAMAHGSERGGGGGGGGDDETTTAQKFDSGGGGNEATEAGNSAGEEDNGELSPGTETLNPSTASCRYSFLLRSAPSTNGHNRRETYGTSRNETEKSDISKAKSVSETKVTTVGCSM